MGPVRVVVPFYVLRQDPVKMTLPQDDEVVQAVSPQRPDNPFADGVHHRRFSGGDDLFDIHHTSAPLESPLKPRVAIVNEKSRRGVIRKGMG